MPCNVKADCFSGSLYVGTEKQRARLTAAGPCDAASGVTGIQSLWEMRSQPDGQLPWGVTVSLSICALPQGCSAVLGLPIW